MNSPIPPLNILRVEIFSILFSRVITINPVINPNKSPTYAKKSLCQYSLPIKKPKIEDTKIRSSLTKKIGFFFDIFILFNCNFMSLIIRLELYLQYDYKKNIYILLIGFK